MSGEREWLGVTDAAPGPGAVWSRSVCAGDTADVPLGIRVFGVGCRLAELIVGLRGDADRAASAPETQRHVDQLNRDFGNLRDILQGPDFSRAEALIDPVIDHLVESLATVGSARSDLARQCESLTADLYTLLHPPTTEPSGDADDSDVPF